MNDITERIVKMDEQGRIYLPKELRKKMGKRVFRVREEKGTFIFKPVEVARKGRGMFKVKTPIENIDEKVEEYTKEVVKHEVH